MIFKMNIASIRNDFLSKVEAREISGARGAIKLIAWNRRNDINRPRGSTYRRSSENRRRIENEARPNEI